ncbi:uncharacterized protein L969DRAFT_93581 [Mixia osmundae IAM 14324]|uniref:Major facilitator superfamily (MFS) profile domain-containing protein n=1 Tax=Mixia osmundae (strain CBS 9802 / IAM 14324 / JCM 22182 / KY 12970) TaxID=764103 RepID=G7DUD9_MIXOS|nr:uncharacterized protein L969DRAFT_93581 [Mixia osmundae IAM 14324]KEI41071.1 hypothetical protein L969DRAFT_93581 [Mixia osmundae IAM 14324]GAA94199.1 hypothetical protein E5Q_00847 [Mixia osmundae IAM 14324]
MQARPKDRPRLYKRRYAGLAALVVLNAVSALNWLLFAPIALDSAARFGITLDQVNWLGNVVCALYLLVSPAVPLALERFGLSRTCWFAASVLVLGGWLRYSSIGASASGAQYAMLFLSQCCVGVAQPILQIVAPTFSEAWMSAESRTTSTMLIAVANPLGAAIGQFLAPALVTRPGDLSKLLLVTALITNISALSAAVIRSQPPTAPTLAAGLTPARDSFIPSVKILLGLSRDEREQYNRPPQEDSPLQHALVKITSGSSEDVEEQADGIVMPVQQSYAPPVKMTKRQRIDFYIILAVFSVLVAAFDAYSTLINQIYEPFGYTPDTSGFFGAAMILAGLAAAFVSAPLLDRVFQLHLGLAARVLTPILGVGFLSFIFVVKRDNQAGIYFVSVVVGVAAFVLLPTALELSAEVTSAAMRPETGSSFLYLGANGLSVVFILIMNAMRASPDDTPPNNMRQALIFLGVICCTVAVASLGIEGKQVRRLLS